jgi:hypothetical protein
VCYTIHSEVLTHKFEAQAEQLLLECQNGFWKGRSHNDPLSSMKLLIEKRKEFNLLKPSGNLTYHQV